MRLSVDINYLLEALRRSKKRRRGCQLPPLMHRKRYKVLRHRCRRLESASFQNKPSTIGHRAEVLEGEKKEEWRSHRRLQARPRVRKVMKSETWISLPSDRCRATLSTCAERMALVVVAKREKYFLFSHYFMKKSEFQGKSDRRQQFSSLIYPFRLFACADLLLTFAAATAAAAAGFDFRSMTARHVQHRLSSQLASHLKITMMMETFTYSKVRHTDSSVSSQKSVRFSFCAPQLDPPPQRS